MSLLYEVQEPSGVYQIRCKRTRQIYVGSSIDIEARWYKHTRDLRARRHGNPHLQRAWLRCGEEAFEFLVLELTGLKRLLRREQLWIARLRATDRKRGFNVHRHATSGGRGHGLTWVGFRNPKGKSVKIVNLFDFCRRNKLSPSAMAQLARGKSKLKSHKGWTHRNSVRVREYIKVHKGYINPNGKPARPIRNLAAFCRDRGLDDTHMVVWQWGGSRHIVDGLTSGGE
jgi:group I intron endonuclease